MTSRTNTKSLQAVRAVLSFLLCTTLLGCIGATPLPKRTRTAEGAEVKNVDVSFIHPGQTSRAEVRDKLKLIDTGYKGDRFFLGRWSSSTWGGWIVLAGMCCEAIGGGGRVWKSGNLLVEFDDAGTVTRSEPFSDTKAIQILGPVAESTPLGLTEPLELQVEYWKVPNAPPVPARVLLSANSLDLEELGNGKKKQKFSVPAADVLRMQNPLGMFPDATYLYSNLHFARDLKKLGGPSGRNLSLHVTMPQLVTLMAYTSRIAKASSGDAGVKPENK